MYEQFRNDFLSELVDNTLLSNEQIVKIMNYLDAVSYRYDIKEKETQLVVYDYELPQLVKIFIACKKVEGLSNKTLYNYTLHLRNLFSYVHKIPQEINANDIRMYLYKYQQERDVANCSLDKIRDCFSSFFKWLYAEEYIDRNPMLSVNKIKTEKKSRTSCSQIELEYLRQACVTKKQRAILEVLYGTGCRVGELVELKKSDINWNEKSVHLFGKGNKHRLSFLNAKAEVALKDYLNSRKDDNEYLFVSDRKPYNKMHTCGIQKIVRDISNRANTCGLNKNVTPHILRHTFSSVLINNNANVVSVQKLLGHENINTTMHYIHTTLDQVKMEHCRSII